MSPKNDKIFIGTVLASSAFRANDIWIIYHLIKNICTIPDYSNTQSNLSKSDTAAPTGLGTRTLGESKPGNIIVWIEAENPCTPFFYGMMNRKANNHFISHGKVKSMSSEYLINIGIKTGLNQTLMPYKTDFVIMALHIGTKIASYMRYSKRGRLC